MSVEPPLHYGRQSIDASDIDAVLDVLRGDWLTQGPSVARFEGMLAEITGARHAIAVANGTAALHLAALAAGVGPGDVGLTSTVTFVASANAIRYAGGRPVLVDVDPDTGLIDVAALDAAVYTLEAAGVRPRVIIPVDFAGAPADLPAIQRIAARTGARVIEDAAHALGATYRVDGRTFRAGGCAHADMAILSFHPVKHITTGEGGAVTTNDDAFARAIRDLRTHGIVREPDRLRCPSEGPWWYEQHTLGFNYRISDLQCALGASQAQRLDRFVARRRQIATRYDEAFAGLSGLDSLHCRPESESSYHLYVVRIRRQADQPLADVAARRLSLFHRLQAAGIHPQVHYIPVHRQPDYRDNGLGSGAFPGADAYYAGCLSLPMHPGLTDGDIDRVIRVLQEAPEVRA